MWRKTATGKLSLKQVQSPQSLRNWWNRFQRNCKVSVKWIHVSMLSQVEIINWKTFTIQSVFIVKFIKNMYFVLHYLLGFKDEYFTFSIGFNANRIYILFLRFHFYTSPRQPSLTRKVTNKIKGISVTVISSLKNHWLLVQNMFKNYFFLPDFERTVIK